MALKGFSSPGWSKISLPNNKNKRNVMAGESGATVLFPEQIREIRQTWLKSQPANICS